MTLRDIKVAISKIQEIRGNDEAARAMEDGLHRAVLQCVADHASEPLKSLAKEALKTEDIDFSRGCAGEEE